MAKKFIRAESSADAKPMGYFTPYVREDSNIKKYYDEFEDAGPAEREELMRCRAIDRRIERMNGGYGPDDELTGWEMEN